MKQVNEKQSTDAEQVASVVLFVLSVVFTIGRIAIRLRYQQKLAVDDAFLIFALVCLCVAMGLLFAFIKSMYLIEALITDNPNLSMPIDIIDQVERYSKLSIAFYVLTFNTTLAVKFSFLFLFKALIRNVRSINIYWWIVFSTTAALYPFGVIAFLSSALNLALNLVSSDLSFNALLFF